MITRVRETDGGYKVSIFTSDAVVDSRIVSELSAAFQLQVHVQEHGAFPAVKGDLK